MNYKFISEISKILKICSHAHAFFYEHLDKIRNLDCGYRAALLVNHKSIKLTKYVAKCSLVPNFRRLE